MGERTGLSFPISIGFNWKKESLKIIREPDEERTDLVDYYNG
jgi:hypothetical protein